MAPDVIVVFGVEDRERMTYRVWEEGKGPDFVLEVASRSTWREDVGAKRAVYARMGVKDTGCTTRWGSICVRGYGGIGWWEARP